MHRSNALTEIRFDLPEPAPVHLVIYDAVGREIERLVDKSMEAGYQRVVWDPSGLSSRVYVYRLTAGNFSETRRMVLLK